MGCACQFVLNCLTHLTSLDYVCFLLHQVSLIEPPVKHSDKHDKNKTVKINKVNNIQWDLLITSGETKELVTKYTVDHPISEEVETNVTHYSNESVA